MYLNPGWTADLGGALRLTHQDNPHEALDILPLSGRIAMFYSSEIPHEVLPTQGDRHAFTIWYYDTEERLAAIQDAKNSGRAAKTSQSSIQSQQEAKAFIGDLMGGDEVGPDGGNPTAEELAELAVKVEKLSDEVVGIVSNITGAPSVQSFRDGFKLLVPEELKSMRKLFRKMGLQ